MWSRSDVEESVERAKENAAATFLADRHIPPVTFLFATQNPDTGKPRKHLMLVPPIGAGGVGQRLTYPLLIRLAAMKGAATGLIFVAEATARVDDGEGQRVVMVLVEHKHHGIVIWRAPVMESGLGSWVQEKGNAQSRFLHLLPEPPKVRPGV